MAEGEAVEEVVPEADAEFLAGFFVAGEGVASTPAVVGAGGTGDFAFDDVFANAGPQVFINKGINGRWVDTLTEEDVREYEARAEAELGADCARWLANGE